VTNRAPALPEAFSGIEKTVVASSETSWSINEALALRSCLRLAMIRPLCQRSVKIVGPKALPVSTENLINRQNLKHLEITVSDALIPVFEVPGSEHPFVRTKLANRTIFTVKSHSPLQHKPETILRFVRVEIVRGGFLDDLNGTGNAVVLGQSNDFLSIGADLTRAVIGKHLRFGSVCNLALKIEV
jgi:hypothetical protein